MKDTFCKSGKSAFSYKYKYKYKYKCKHLYLYLFLEKQKGEILKALIIINSMRTKKERFRRKLFFLCLLAL